MDYDCIRLDDPKVIMLSRNFEIGKVELIGTLTEQDSGLFVGDELNGWSAEKTACAGKMGKALTV